MAAIHDVLRYLLERTAPRTQEEHDSIAELIEADRAQHEPVSDHNSSNEPVSGGQ